MRDYTFAEARTVLRKMVYGSRMDLTEKGLACGSVDLYVGYSGRVGDGAGPTHAGGSCRPRSVTTSERAIVRELLGLYDGTVSRSARVCRANISLGELAPMRTAQLSLFEDRAALEREEGLARAAMLVRSRYGPNALLRATSLIPEANSRERNLQVGGGTVRDRSGVGSCWRTSPSRATGQDSPRQSWSAASASPQRSGGASRRTGLGVVCQ